jgi:integrase
MDRAQLVQGGRGIQAGLAGYGRPAVATTCGTWQRPGLLKHVPLKSDPEQTDPRVFPALPSHLSDLFKKHAVKAKLQDVTFHTLRHTFCSRLVQAGVPLRMVQVLARHSNIEVTERYAHVGDGHTREAVERLSEYEAEARKALEKVTQGVTEKVIPL